MNRVLMDTDHLSALVSGLAREHGVPGAQVAVHWAGTSIAVECGEQEYGSGRAVTRDTAFPAGSIAKAFTATCAMVLVADGELGLDTPVGEYLSEMDSGSTGAGLTLRQLLSHTGGLASSPELDARSAASCRRYVLDHCHRPELVDEPGACFSYSNMGYVLTGYLIETITGMSWWEAMESIVLRPLGIRPAFVAGPDPRDGRPMVTGHAGNAEAGVVRPVRQACEPAEAPAGALALSAMDLLRFGLIHLDGVPELLPAAYAEQMRTPVPAAEPFGVADGWGLGLAWFRGDTGDWVGHDGTGHGTWSHLRISPADDTVVAVTTNASTGLGLWEGLVAELRQAGLPVPSGAGLRIPALSVPAPPDCAGTYFNGDVEYSITPAFHGGLRLAIDAEDYASLTFHRDLSFSLRENNSGQRMYAGRLLRDPVTGEFDRIQVSGRVARRRATRETDRC